jgi:hypothetical protein
MAEVVNIKELSAAIWNYRENVPLFDILTATLSIQGAYDPEAGYGVFQATALYRQINIDDVQTLKLLSLCGGNQVRFYAFLRLWSLSDLVGREKLITRIDQQDEPNWEDLSWQLQQKLPSWRHDRTENII